MTPDNDTTSTCQLELMTCVMFTIFEFSSHTLGLHITQHRLRKHSLSNVIKVTIKLNWLSSTQKRHKLRKSYLLRHNSSNSSLYHPILLNCHKWKNFKGIPIWHQENTEREESLVPTRVTNSDQHNEMTSVYDFCQFYGQD